MNFKRIIISYKALVNVEGLKYKIMSLVISPMSQYFLYGIIITTVADGSYITEMLAGMVLFNGANKIRLEMSDLVRTEKRYKVLELLIASPTKFFSVCFDKVVFCFLGSIFFVIINYTILSIIFRINISFDFILWGSLSIIVTLISGCSFAMFCTPLVLPMKNVNLFSNIITSFLIISSGAVISTELYPTYFYTVSKLLPFRNGIEAARKLMLNDYSECLNLLFVESCIALCCFGLSFVLFLVLEKVSRKNGGIIDTYF